MKIQIILTTLAAALLVSCAFEAPYRPASRPEKIEFHKDHLDISPDSVRKDPARYANMRVAWAGVVVTNAIAPEDLEAKIGLDTILEHRYFDWDQDELAGYAHFEIASRGEGQFRVRWRVRRLHEQTSENDAVEFAAPGKLAIVYGTIESVDPDGTIVLGYHWIRVLNPGRFKVTGKVHAEG